MTDNRKKVASALSASNAMRGRGGFIPDWNSYKIEELTLLLAGMGLSADAIDKIIANTKIAIDNYYIATPPLRKGTRSKLEVLERHLKKAADAWSDIGCDLQNALINHARARLIASSTPSNIQQEFTGREWITEIPLDQLALADALGFSKRTRKFLGGDHVAVMAGAKALRELPSGAHAPDQYQLIIHVCCIWRDATGHGPPMPTNVKNENTGTNYDGHFMRFINAAIASEPPISKEVIRDAIAAFRLGAS